MRIDVHAHIVDADYLDRLKTRMGLEAVRANDKILLRKDGHTVAWYRDAMFDIEARLRDMDLKGIDVRIVSLSAPNVYAWDSAEQVAMARDINNLTARLCRRHPDRFRGLASLPLVAPEASLAEIDRALGDLDLAGIAIGSNVAGLPVNDPSFEPIWAQLDARGVPVFMHPMFPANTSGMEAFELPLRVGFVFDTTVAAARLIFGGVLERYPRLKIILAHTGGTLLMLAERLDNGFRLFPECREHITQLPSVYVRRLYYDTASFFPPALMMAHQIVGAGQILLGTDDPFIGADTGHVDVLDLPAADKTAILGGTAAELFRIRQV